MADVYRTVKNLTIGTTYRKDANPAAWEELIAALQSQFEARNISTPVGIHVIAAGASGIVEFHLKDDPKTSAWNLRGRVGLEVGGSGPTSYFIAGPKIVNREAYSLRPQPIEENTYSLMTPGPGRSAASVLSEQLVGALYSGQGRTRSVASFGKALRAQLDEFGNYDAYPSMAKRYGGNAGGMIPSDPSVSHFAYTNYVKNTLAQARAEGWSPEKVSEMLVVPSQSGVSGISAEQAVFGGYKKVTGYSVRETSTLFGTVVGEDEGGYAVFRAGKEKSAAKRVENLANVPIEVAGFERARGTFQAGPMPLEGQVMTHLVMPNAILGPGEAAANFQRFAGKSATAPWSTRSFLKNNTLIRAGTFAPNAWREDPNQAYLSHDTTRLGPTGMKSLEVTEYRIEYPLDWDERKIQRHRGSLQAEYLKAVAAGGQNLVDPSGIPYGLGRGTLTGEPTIVSYGNTILPNLFDTNFGVKEQDVKAYGNMMRIAAGAPIDLTSKGAIPQFNVLGVDRAPDWVMSPKNQIKAEPSYALQAFASLPRTYLDRLFSDVGEMERYGISQADVAAIQASSLYSETGGYMHPSLVNRLINLSTEKVFGHTYSAEEPWGKVRAEQFVQVSPAIRGGIQNMLDNGEITGEFVERNGRTYFYGQSDAWIVPRITTVRDLYPGDVTSQTLASGQSSSFVDRERFLTRGRPDERAWNLYHAVAGTAPQDNTISIDDIRNNVNLQALTDPELTAFMKSGPYSDKFIDLGGMVLEPGRGAIEVLDSGELSAYANQWVRTLREASTIPPGMGVREEAYQLRALRNTMASSEDFVSRLGQRQGIARHVTGTVGMGGPGDAIYIGDDVIRRAFDVKDDYELDMLKLALSEGKGAALASRPPIGELMKYLGLRIKPMEDLYPDDPELAAANRNRIVVPQEVQSMMWGDFDRDPFSFEAQMYRDAMKAWQGIRIGNDLDPHKFYGFLAQYAAGKTRQGLLSGNVSPQMLGQAIRESGYTEIGKMFADLREGTAENFVAAAKKGLSRVGLDKVADKFQGRALGKAAMGFGYVPLESLKQYFMARETKSLRQDASKSTLRAVEQRVSDKMSSFLGIYQNLLDVSPFRGRKMMALGTHYSEWLKKTKGKESPAAFWNAPAELEFGDLPKVLAKVSKKTGHVSYTKPSASYEAGHAAAADAFAEMVIGEEFGHLLGAGSGQRFDLKGSIPIPATAAALLFGFEGDQAKALQNIAFALQSGDETTVVRGLESNLQFWEKTLAGAENWDIALGHAAINKLTRGQAGSGALSQEELMQYSYASAMTKPYAQMLQELGYQDMESVHRGFRAGTLTEYLYDKFQKAARSAENLANDPAAMAAEFIRGLPGADLYSDGPTAFVTELFQRARETLPANSSTAYAFAMMQQGMAGGLSGLPSGRRLAFALRGKLNEKQWNKLAMGGKASLTQMNPAEYNASSLLQFPGIPETLDDVSRWVGTPFMNQLHALTMEAGSPKLTGQAAVNEAKYIRTSLLQKLISEQPPEAQEKIASLLGMKAGGKGFAAMAGLKFDELLQEGVNRTQGTVFVKNYPGSASVYGVNPPSVDAFLSEFSRGKRGIKRDVLEGWYKSLPEGERDVLAEGVTRVLPAMSAHFAGWNSKPPEMDADALEKLWGPDRPEPVNWGDDAFDESSLEQTLAQEAPESEPPQRPQSYDEALERAHGFRRAARERRDLGDDAGAALLSGEAERYEGAALEALRPMTRVANRRMIEQWTAQRDEYLRTAQERENQGQAGPARWWRSKADLLSKSIDVLLAQEAPEAGQTFSGPVASMAGSGFYGPMAMAGSKRPAAESIVEALEAKIADGKKRAKASLDANDYDAGVSIMKDVLDWQAQLQDVRSGASVSTQTPEKPRLDPEDINLLLAEASREGREEQNRIYVNGEWLIDASAPQVAREKARPLGNQVDADRAPRNTAVVDLDTGEVLQMGGSAFQEGWQGRVQNLREAGNLAEEVEETPGMQERVSDAIAPFLLEAAHQKARTAVGSSSDAISYAENFLAAFHAGVYGVKKQGAKGIQKEPGVPALKDLRQLGATLDYRGRQAAMAYLVRQGYSEREASEVVRGYGSTRANTLTIEAKTPQEAAGILDAQAAVEPSVLAAVKKFGRSAMSQGGIFATSEGAPVEVKVSNWKDATDPMAIAVKAGTLAAQQVLTGSASGSGAAGPPATPGGGAPGVPGGTVPPGAGAAAAFAAAGGGAGAGGGRSSAGGAQETMLGDLGFLLFNIRRVSWLTMESVKKSMETYAGVEQKAAQIHAMATGEIDRSAPGFRIWASNAAFEKAGLAFGKKAFGMWGGAYSSDVGEMLESAAGGPLGGILAAGLPMAGLAGIGNMIGKTLMKRAGPGGVLEQQAGLISGLTTASQMLPAAFAIGSYQNYLARKSEDVGEIAMGTAANVGGTLLFSSIAKGMLAGTAFAPYIAPVTAGAIAIEAISGGIGLVRAANENVRKSQEYFGDRSAEREKLADLAAIQAEYDERRQEYDLNPTDENWQKVQFVREKYERRLHEDEGVGEKAPTPEAIARYEDLLTKIGSSSVKWYGTDRALELAAGFESAGFGLKGSEQDKALFARAAEFDFATGLGAEGAIRAGLGYLSKLGIAPWEAQAKSVQGNYFQLLQSQARGVQDLLASTRSLPS